MGLADVDPFILGIAQSAGHDVPVVVGAAGVVVARQQQCSQRLLCILFQIAGLDPQVLRCF